MVSLLRSLQHHSDELSSAAFSAALLATCSMDKTLRVYSTADFTELPFSPLSGHGYGVHCCCFSPCGRFLLSCSTDGAVFAWATDTGERTAVFQHPDRSPLRVCALAPDSSLVLAGACDGTAALWDFTCKTLRRCSAVSEASVAAAAFSPCGQFLVTGCSRGDVKLWDTDFELLLMEKDAHDLGVTCCGFANRFTVDGRCVEFRLASCGQDSRLKIWMVFQREGADCTMKILHILTSHSAPVLCCTFSSDGDLIVSGSVDKSVLIHDVTRGTVLHILKHHTRYVTAVAVSPTMPWIASGSMDRTVNVWRIGDAGENTEAADPSPGVCQGRKAQGQSRSLLSLSDWSEEEVQAWLREEGLEELVGVFKDNHVDGAQLLHVKKETVAELGIESLGLRSRLLRKINGLKVQQDDSEVPDEFLCPISRELMKDPVMAADGFSYERDSMEGWIRGRNRTSPMTNLPLLTTLLTPNRSLKMAIERWTSGQ